MLHRSALIVALAAAAGCVAQVETEDPPPIVVSETAQASAGALIDGTDEPPDNICDLLPLDGPCSLGCDQEALVAQYVPVGTCVVFACELTDGRTAALHACHAPA